MYIMELSWREEWDRSLVKEMLPNKDCQIKRTKIQDAH